MLSALLNKRITVEKGTNKVSSILTQDLVYETFYSMYAGVYVRGASAKFGESEELVITTEFTIRYSRITKQITNKDRILYNGNYYRILEIIETEPKMTLKIIAERWSNE